MRYIHDHILQDLERKMVFIGGPRQVGKTFLAQHILDTAGFSGRYFNWDYGRDRQDLLAEKLKSTVPDSSRTILPAA